MYQATDLRGTNDAPMTPRRRTSSPPPGENTIPHRPVPVLLRLPDLYPSAAVDAAVARLSTGHGSRKQATSDHVALEAAAEQSGTRGGSAPPATEAATPPVGARSFLPMSGEWSNRLIVSGFCVVLIAGIFLSYERAKRRGDAARAALSAAAQDSDDQFAWREEGPSVSPGRGELPQDGGSVDPPGAGLPANGPAAVPAAVEPAAAASPSAERRAGYDDSVIPASTTTVVSGPTVEPYVPQALRLRDSAVPSDSRE